MNTRARECSITDDKPFRYQFSLGLKFPLLEKDVLALSKLIRIASLERTEGPDTVIYLLD